MNLFDYLFGFFIISIVIGFIILIFYGLTMFNFVQLDNLNNRTCELAGIPVENCFCEMDV